MRIQPQGARESRRIQRLKVGGVGGGRPLLAVAALGAALNLSMGHSARPSTPSWSSTASKQQSLNPLGS